MQSGEAVWLNGGVFVYELSGFSLKSRCCLVFCFSNISMGKSPEYFSNS